MIKLKHILIFLLLLSVFACSKDETIERQETGTEAASLSLSISSVGLSVQTRGLETPKSDPSTWTPMDRAIDGREIYRLTLFLINKNNKLVAYRNIYKGSTDINQSNGFWTGAAVGQNLLVGQQVKATFDYNSPKHGDTEKLVQGEYTLIAVANYSEYETYGGLNTTASFTNIIDQIIAEFGTIGIENFTRSQRGEFFEYELNAGTDYVCPKQPQPLTLIKKIQLLPGNNSVSGELKRSYARIRINLRNDSQSLLTCHSLSFNQKFAKQYTYLFEDPDNPDAGYNYKQNAIGAPSLITEDAIKTFTGPIDLSQQTSQVLYDAYILESKREKMDYTYTLDLGYEGECSFLSESPITNTSELSDFYTKTNMFLIKRGNANRFLFNNASDYVASQETDLATIQSNRDNDPTSILPYIWDLSKEEGANNSYSIKANQGKYIDNIYQIDPKYIYALSDIGYSETPVYFLLKQDSYYPYGTFINQNVSGHDIYLSIANTGEVSSQFKMEDHLPFVFYPIKFAKYNSPIQLHTIDPITSKVTEVSSIKRNDFINIFVTSNYSRTNGIQAFIVKDWELKNSDISYN